MCFYNDDYDWIAAVERETDLLASENTKCNECGRTIKAGERLRHVYRQEAEECKDCDEGECKCADGKCCQCPAPNIGETFDYDCCEECSKFLQAVEDTEIEAGCRKANSRPGLTEMIEEIRNNEIEAARPYFKMAVRKYPELVKSGYLGKLWNRIFV